MIVWRSGIGRLVSRLVGFLIHRLLLWGGVWSAVAIAGVLLLLAALAWARPSRPPTEDA